MLLIFDFFFFVYFSVLVWGRSFSPLGSSVSKNGRACFLALSSTPIPVAFLSFSLEFFKKKRQIMTQENYCFWLYTAGVSITSEIAVHDSPLKAAV